MSPINSKSNNCYAVMPEPHHYILWGMQDFSYFDQISVLYTIPFTAKCCCYLDPGNVTHGHHYYIITFTSRYSADYHCSDSTVISCYRGVLHSLKSRRWPLKSALKSEIWNTFASIDLGYFVFICKLCILCEITWIISVKNIARFINSKEVICRNVINFGL